MVPRIYSQNIEICKPITSLQHFKKLTFFLAFFVFYSFQGFSQTCPGAISVECESEAFSAAEAAVTASACTPVTAGSAVYVGTPPTTPVCSGAGVSATVRVIHGNATCGAPNNFCDVIVNITGDANPPVFIENPGDLDINEDCAADVNLVAPTATDNCGGTPTISIMSDMTAPGTCVNDFVRTVIYEAEDDCGNASTYTVTITVDDDEAPTFDDAPGPLNINEKCAADVNLVTPTATDNCGGTPTVSILSDMTVAGSCANQFVRTITYEAEDECGNTSLPFTVIITVNDDETPTFNEPAGSLDMMEECAADVMLVAPTATDNCTGTPTVTVLTDVTVPGTCPNQFVRTVTYQAMDDCGNLAIFPVTITVNDNVAPTFVEPAGSLDMMVKCAADVMLVAPTATDNCAGTPTVAVLTDITVPGTCPNQFVRTVTYQAMDDCGNLAIFPVIIIVNDDVAPTFNEAVGSLDINEDCAADVTLVAPTATDNCAGTPMVTVMSDATVAGACVNQFVRTVIYEAVDDCGNTSTFTVTITVDDNMTPTFNEAVGSLDINEDCAADVTLVAPTATDNCAGTTMVSVMSDMTVPASPTCANQFVRTVIYEAEDECGNTSTFTVTITVDDNMAPTFNEAVGSLDMTVQCATDANLVAPTATDNCTGTTIVSIMSDVTVPSSCVNDFVRTVIYEAEDECGNTSTFTVTITVDDNMAPTGSAPASIIIPTTVSVCRSGALAYATANHPFVPATVAMGYSDNCSTIDATSITLTSTVDSGDDCNWDVTYAYNVEDECGNILGSETWIISGGDTDAPTGTCPTGDLASANNDCMADAVATATSEADTRAMVIAAYTDDCSAAVTVTLVSGPIVGGDDCAWSVTYTYDVEDDCGNMIAGGCTVVHLGGDTDAPTWTTAAGALDVMNLECGNGAALATAIAVQPVATDDCTAAGSITITPTVGAIIPDPACPNGGTVTVTYTATDACSNVSSVYTRTITIVDTTIPTWLTVPGSLDVTLDCGNTTGLMTAQTFIPSAVDNCSSASNITITPDPANNTLVAGACPNVGSYTNTWTATDECMNVSAVFTQTITITDNNKPTLAGSIDVTVPCGNTTGLMNAQNLLPVATDNCSAAADITIVETSGAFVPDPLCPNAGTYTNTFVATDECGNMSAMFTQVITLTDNVAPTGTAPAGTTGINDCLANAPAFDAVAAAAGYTDDCGTVTAVFTSTSSTGDNCSWTVTHTFAVEDDCGNSLTGQTITHSGSDMTAPTIPTVADFSVNNAAGNCFNTVNLTVPGVTDNCGTVTHMSSTVIDPKGNPISVITPTTAPIAVLPVGPNDVKMIFSDGCGNIDSIEYIITVLDTEAPIITCVGSQIVNFSACNSAMLVPDFRGLAAVTDNCGGSNTITQIPSQFDSLNLHTSVVDGATFNITLIVTDNNANGGSDSCSFIVTLSEDDMPVPSISGGTLPTVSSSCGVITVDAPTAMDACGNLICGDPTPNTSALYIGGTCASSGPILIPPFIGGTGTLGDNSPNELNCNSSNLTHTFTTTVSGIGTIGAGSATLENINIDLLHTWVGDLEISIQSPTGTTLVLSDNNGFNGDNMVTNFADGNPSITTSSPPFIGTFEAEGGTFASTFDGENADGVWTLTINDVAFGDCGWLNFWDMTFSIPPPPGSIPQYQIPVGNHTIFWIYDDGFGNTTQQIQQFNITNDNIAPIITCASLTLALDSTGMTGTSASSLAVQFTDNCAIDSTTLLVNGQSNISFSCTDLGTTNVNLTIADTSGNVGSCMASITIVDNIAPIFDTIPPSANISCDSILASSGLVTATDNCGTVGMNFNDVSSQLSSPMMCGYYNYTVTRTWVATDGSGNATTQVQTIGVSDTLAPQFTFPDTTILANTNQLTCDANVNNNFVNITTADLVDNCAAFADLTISYTATLADGTITSGTNGNASGTYPMGTNVITFTAVDPCGNTAIKTLTLIVDDTSAPVASCTTTITIGIPQGQSSITLPASLVDNGSFDNCKPIVIELYRLASNGVTLLPPVFDCTDADNSTLHPVVLYVYEDLGGGNLGQFSTCETSVIVQDNTNPVAVCQDITVFLDANGNATITPADIDGGSFDNCTAAANLTYQLLTPSTYNISNIGTNTAQLVVTDASGNNSLCSATVTVAPPVTCFNVDNGINGGGFMAGTGISEVPVTSSDFVNGLGFQFTLEINDTVGTFAGINNIDPVLAANGLLTNQINATGDTLTISWLNTSGTPLTLNTVQLFTISVNVVGIVGSSTVINFINSPTPPEFTSQYGGTIFTNPDYPPCTTNGLVLVNNTATLTVSGNVRTWGISQTVISSIDPTTMPPDTTFTTNIIVPVQNVQNVLIEKDEDAAGFSFGATTDIDGNYVANISNVSGGVDLDLHPSKNINWLNNGDVSSSDLFFIQQHIVANIPFTSVYEYLASDVNQDGLVTTLDLVLIQDVIVNPPGSPNPSLVIANFEPWRFIPAADSLHNFPLPALPNSTPVGYTGTDIISFTNYSTPMTDVDWIAVKIGQVFGSLDPTLLVQIDPTLVSTLADERNGNDLVMKAENQKVKNGELISIPVYADDYASFISWQFTLEFDENTLAYENVLPGAITNFGEGRLGLNAVEEGIIGAAWYGLPQSIDENEALFTLQFRALEDADALSGLIDITSTTVKAESYLMNNSLGNVSLEFFTPESSIAIGDFELHQNRPNPFNETTLISFVLPEAGIAQLSVFDISGRVLKIVEGDFAKGYNEINIRSNDISATGVLYYKLESAKHTATKKMIILN